MNTENMWLILNDFLKNKNIPFYEEIFSVGYFVVNDDFDISLINTSNEQIKKDDVNNVYFDTIRDFFISNNFNKRESTCFIFDNKKEDIERFLSNNYTEQRAIDDFEINTSSIDQSLSSKGKIIKKRKKK